MKRWWKIVRRPPWRTIVLGLLFVATAFASYALWSPGMDVTDGRHDRRRNAIWLQHGWLGDDAWFARNYKAERIGEFRNPARIAALADLLREHHITDVFPHASPADVQGQLPPVDHDQVERLLESLGEGFRVLPWTGGVLEDSARPYDARWRKTFTASIAELLHRHPRLAGIHINIEPCPTGDRSYLSLLDELRDSLPSGKLLSVAAYPPPTRWHPYPQIHWNEEYFRQVARRVDQMAVMMYDTGLRYGRVYEDLMRRWTRECLKWGEDTHVLFGVPTYDDAGVGYHYPQVENISHALRGIHAGLAELPHLPNQYQGAAIYCEWEMDQGEWRHWRDHFLDPEETP
jgi:hypothetical protein